MLLFRLFPYVPISDFYADCHTLHHRCHRRQDSVLCSGTSCTWHSKDRKQYRTWRLQDSPSPASCIQILLREKYTLLLDSANQYYYTSNFPIFQGFQASAMHPPMPRSRSQISGFQSSPVFGVVSGCFFGLSFMTTVWISPVSFTVNFTSSAFR